MPITSSAKKALRQNVRRRRENLRRMKQVKDAVKAYRALVVSNKDEAKKALGGVYKKIDKLAKTNYIAKNKASRLKSRLARLIKK